MKLGHYKIWPDNCCKTWSGICCKGWPKNYCKVWFKKLQKSAQKCCKESKCDQYLLWILRTVSIGYNFDWNFGLEIVAEFGREKFGREKYGREKFGREMLQKLAEKSSAGNVAEIGRKILLYVIGKRLENLNLWSVKKKHPTEASTLWDASANVDRDHVFCRSDVDGVLSLNLLKHAKLQPLVGMPRQSGPRCAPGKQNSNLSVDWDHVVWSIGVLSL